MSVDAEGGGKRWRPKGVVSQGNGKWGAQIYHGSERLWLGTFENINDAATAYDTAALKLKLEANNSASAARAQQLVRCNFPIMAVSENEVEFLRIHSVKQIETFLRDHSYAQRLQDYITGNHNSINSDVDNGSNNKAGNGSEAIQKTLTLSDIGPLNRLVLPKAKALRHLPLHDVTDKTGKFVEVLHEGQRWEFRLAYRGCSKCYVFTTGWRNFVRQHSLKKGDVVSLRCSNNNIMNNVPTIHISFLRGSIRLFGTDIANVGQVHP